MILEIVPQRLWGYHEKTMSGSIFTLLSGTVLAFARFLTGMARVKGISVLFGPLGVGLMAQATQFQMVAASAASFSIVTAMIQALKSRPEADRKMIFSTAFTMLCTGLFIFYAVLLLVGIEDLYRWLFGNLEMGREFYFFLLSIPFIIFSSGFLESIFFAENRFDKYVYVSIIHSVVQLIIYLTLGYFFGISGLFYAFILSSLALFILYFFYIKKFFPQYRSMFSFGFNFSLAKYFFSNGFVMFATGVGGGFAVLAVRSRFIDNAGIAANGLLQVAVAISAYYGAVITNFIWGKIHLKYSEVHEAEDSFDLSLLVFIGFSLILGTWILSPWLIPLIYSKEFSPALALVFIQGAGDIIYFSFFALSVVSLARGHVWSYFSGWVIYFAVYACSVLIREPDVNGEWIIKFHLFASFSAFLLIIALIFWQKILHKKTLFRMVFFTLCLESIYYPLLWLDIGAGIMPRILLATLSFLIGLFAWRIFSGREMRDKLVIWARLGIKRFQLLKPWAVLSRNSRLLAKLAPQYRDFPRHYDVSFNRDGIAFHSDLSDYLDWKFFFSPWNSERKRLFSMIKKGQKIIDVGAHHGATAITLAKLVGTNGFVHCFEPSTENKMRLDKNISSNKGLNIFSYGIAMGEKKMEVNMANPAPSNSSGNRIILENSGVKSGGAKMDILDHWINSNLSGVGIDWLKVTVNGFEHKVFSGAQEILKTQHPNLYFELSSENLSAQGNTAKEFLHYLESFGYEFQIASNATKISSDSANMDAMNADVIALWKGK